MNNTTIRSLSSSSLTSTDVYNLEGKHIGSIEELMINLDNGSVSYAVLSFGGFLGFGDKLFAVPWAALKIDTEKERFLLDADKELLENAPGFDQNNWPETHEREWFDEMYRYYGVEATPAMNY